MARHCDVMGNGASCSGSEGVAVPVVSNTLTSQQPATVQALKTRQGADGQRAPVTVDGDCDSVGNVDASEDPVTTLQTKGMKERDRCRCSKDCCNGILLEDTAALKLRLLLEQLDRGEVPQIVELRKVVRLASEALVSQCYKETEQSEEERLECVRDRQVREWLSVTFTRVDSLYDTHHVSMTPIVKFKAAANTIIISHYLGSIHRTDVALPYELQSPQPLTEHLQKYIDKWEFDMFEMEKLSDNLPFRYVAHHLMKKHNLFEKFEIPVSNFDSFLVKIEEGYSHHGNPYHNASHGADVAQTLHYFLNATGLKALMSDLEILSALLAALVHDVHHPGTTNGFQVNKRSEYALLYNDRSVLENHHLYYSFKSLQETNFLKSLSGEDYKLLRGLMIEMVLATDMSSHFDQLKHMRHVMSLPEAGFQLQGVERVNAFSLLLHIADISHPGKPWPLHLQWSMRLAEEYYRQGDEEQQQGLPFSPLCDRNNTNLPTSQIGFIEHIVSPSFELCGDMLELLLGTAYLPKLPHGGTHDANEMPHANEMPRDIPHFRLWEQYLSENRAKWREQERSKTVLADVNQRSEGTQDLQQQQSNMTTPTTTITILQTRINGERESPII